MQYFTVILNLQRVVFLNKQQTNFGRENIIAALLLYSENL